MEGGFVDDFGMGCLDGCAGSGAVMPGVYVVWVALFCVLWMEV